MRAAARAGTRTGPWEEAAAAPVQTRPPPPTPSARILTATGPPTPPPRPAPAAHPAPAGAAGLRGGAGGRAALPAAATGRWPSPGPRPPPHSGGRLLGPSPVTWRREKELGGGGGGRSHPRLPAPGLPPPALPGADAQGRSAGSPPAAGEAGVGRAAAGGGLVTGRLAPSRAHATGLSLPPACPGAVPGWGGRSAPGQEKDTRGPCKTQQPCPGSQRSCLLNDHLCPTMTTTTVIIIDQGVKCCWSSCDLYAFALHNLYAPKLWMLQLQRLKQKEAVESLLSADSSHSDFYHPITLDGLCNAFTLSSSYTTA
ncbi:uncharacterized protein [Lepidochelys kempii]|uniref:uncharacterized protein n=1 Tax=Lepidochelys kempii TaxID=8472 RepID=UPI003C6F4A40